MKIVFTLGVCIYCLLLLTMLVMTLFDIPIYRLGFPIYSRDVKWTWFIYRHLKDMEKLDSEHFKVEDKVVVFYDSWIFEVYTGNSVEEIKHKYSLGGQSNRADYLTWWQKIIGRKIENWYLTQKQ